MKHIRKYENVFSLGMLAGLAMGLAGTGFAQHNPPTLQENTRQPYLPQVQG